MAPPPTAPVDSLRPSLQQGGPRPFRDPSASAARSGARFAGCLGLPSGCAGAADVSWLGCFSALGYGRRFATMGTRRVVLFLLAAVLLQALLPGSDAEGLVRIPLKKRPIDLNSRVTTMLSGDEEAARPLLHGGANAADEGDIVGLKNYMNGQYFGEIASAPPRRSSPSSSTPAAPTSGCPPPGATSRLRATCTHATRLDSQALTRRMESLLPSSMALVQLLDISARISLQLVI